MRLPTAQTDMIVEQKRIATGEVIIDSFVDWLCRSLNRKLCPSFAQNRTSQCTYLHLHARWGNVTKLFEGLGFVGFVRRSATIGSSVQ
jgi:hypothetical protein